MGFDQVVTVLHKAKANEEVYTLGLPFFLRRLILAIGGKFAKIKRLEMLFYSLYFYLMVRFWLILNFRKGACGIID